METVDNINNSQEEVSYTDTSGKMPSSDCNQSEEIADRKIIRDIYSLRSKFLIIGLTGRTGSGCTSVAKIFATKDPGLLASNYKEFGGEIIDNTVRKDRIVYNFIKENWNPFIVITASDIIYYFALQQPFDTFCKYIADSISVSKMTDKDSASAEKIKSALAGIKDDYDKWQKELNGADDYLVNKGYQSEKDENKLSQYKDLILDKLPQYRKKIERIISKTDAGIIKSILQSWGDKLREYGQIDQTVAVSYSPEAIAKKINQIIKLLRKYNELKCQPTFIVIDALRNPFEILFFRERYSAFYCMSVNTPQKVRHDKLMKDLKLNYEDVLNIDKKESGEGIDGIKDSFTRINIDKCIELSDIHISHHGEPVDRNRNLVNQLFTYLALMFHPGLVPPTPQERLMQIAYTAKLNSGCLSRQVGAAVTDADFSLKAIGWNSTPAGQVPCNLRQLDDLFRHEDEEAFSDHELNDQKFQTHISKLKCAYDKNRRKELKGLGLTYCFKNIHTKIEDKQKNNQVHTRSLHAEENAILQISKYGGEGLKGGKLFTTASCCELCAKKAFHIGIREIYYIDTYPGISSTHIFGCGKKENRPKLILFTGAVGRAYINLFNPFLPLKDELEALTGVKVGSPEVQNITNQKTKTNGGNNQSQ